jgi:hypothetical protein
MLPPEPVLTNFLRTIRTKDIGSNHRYGKAKNEACVIDGVGLPMSENADVLSGIDWQNPRSRKCRTFRAASWRRVGVRIAI